MGRPRGGAESGVMWSQGIMDVHGEMLQSCTWGQVLTDSVHVRIMNVGEEEEAKARYAESGMARNQGRMK